MTRWDTSLRADNASLPSTPVVHMKTAIPQAALYTNVTDLTQFSATQWDRAISSMLIRSSLGLSFGVIFSVLLFKRRAWPAWIGLGFGAGRAWEEADGN